MQLNPEQSNKLAEAMTVYGDESAPKLERRDAKKAALAILYDASKEHEDETPIETAAKAQAEWERLNPKVLQRRQIERARKRAADAELARARSNGSGRRGHAPAE